MHKAGFPTAHVGSGASSMGQTGSAVVAIKSAKAGRNMSGFVQAARFGFARCPRCANHEAYVTRMEPAIQDPNAEILSCHCGKCAHRFEVIVQGRLEPAPLAADRTLLQDLAR